MHLDDFDFPLDPDRIAKRPATPRDSARLLSVVPSPVGGSPALSDLGVLDLPGRLRPGDHLVFNDTRVVPAALTGRRDDVVVKMLLHRQLGPDRWQAFARPAKRLKPGHRVEVAEDLTFEVEEKTPVGDVVLRALSPDPMPALDRHGRMPLPPYIRGGEGDDRDRRDYQTLFAARPGAVAAPTAALHFTPRLLQALETRGIGWSCVTLHVGPGTFLPVKTDDPSRHVMHAETGEVSQATADRLNEVRSAGGRIVAVGSTSLRTLEAAAGQDGSLRAFAGDIDLFILPGYRFKAVDLMMTNFHLPKSTLVMLVAALCGLDTIKAAYAHAQAAGYRFFSYGDATLLHPAPGVLLRDPS